MSRGGIVRVLKTASAPKPPIPAPHKSPPARQVIATLPAPFPNEILFPSALAMASFSEETAAQLRSKHRIFPQMFGADTFLPPERGSRKAPQMPPRGAEADGRHRSTRSFPNPGSCCRDKWDFAETHKAPQWRVAGPQSLRCACACPPIPPPKIAAPSPRSRAGETQFVPTGDIPPIAYAAGRRALLSPQKPAPPPAATKRHAPEIRESLPPMGTLPLPPNHSEIPCAAI